MIISLILGMALSFGLGSYVSSNHDVAGRLEEQQQELFDNVRKSTYYVMMGSGAGTGFVATAPSGALFIVTNAHVCDFATSGLVVNSENVGASAKVVDIFDDYDICLLSAPKGAIPLPFATTLNNNDIVYSVGFPGNSPFITLSSGRIRGLQKNMAIKYPILDNELTRCGMGSKSRKVFDPTLGIDFCTVIQDRLVTTILTDKGASGSAIVNADGEVVGVLNAAGSVGPPWALGIPLKSLKKALSGH